MLRVAGRVEELRSLERDELAAKIINRLVESMNRKS